MRVALMRVDPLADVVAWFKKKADKYQTEINSVLRNYMLKRS